MDKHQEFQAQNAQMPQGGSPYPPQQNAPPPYGEPSGGYAQPAPPGGYPQAAPPGGYAQAAPPGGYAQAAPPGGYAQAAPPGGYGQAAPPGGYVQTGAPQGQQTFVTQTVVTQNKNNSGLRTAIPELPMALAIVLCVLNIIFPGLGTIIAGFSVLCCGNVGQSGGGRFGTFCINFWVGLLQMFLVFFIVGWVWSIMWGVAFIAIASDAQRKHATTTTTTTVAAVPGQQPPGQAYGYSSPQSQIVVAST